MTEIWQLFGGLFIALIFASSVGYILKRRSGVDTPNSVIDNLNARINAWWVMIGIIFIASLLGFLWRNWALFDYFIYGIA